MTKPSKQYYTIFTGPCSCSVVYFAEFKTKPVSSGMPTNDVMENKENNKIT